MSRTERISVVVSPDEKKAIALRARRNRSRSSSSFLRLLGLSGYFPEQLELISTLSSTDLQSRLAHLQTELFTLKFLIESESGICLSRLSEAIDPIEEPLAFCFSVYAEKLRSLYQDVQQQDKT